MSIKLKKDKKGSKPLFDDNLIKFHKQWKGALAGLAGGLKSNIHSDWLTSTSPEQGITYRDIENKLKLKPVEDKNFEKKCYCKGHYHLYENYHKGWNKDCYWLYTGGGCKSNVEDIKANAIKTNRPISIDGEYLNITWNPAFNETSDKLIFFTNHIAGTVYVEEKSEKPSIKDEIVRLYCLTKDICEEEERKEIEEQRRIDIEKKRIYNIVNNSTDYLIDIERISKPLINKLLKEYKKKKPEYDWNIVLEDLDRDLYNIFYEYLPIDDWYGNRILDEIADYVRDVMKEEMEKIDNDR